MADSKYIKAIMKQAGMLAAITMYRLYREEPSFPILLKPQDKEEFSLDFIESNNLPDLLCNLKHQDQLPYQILAHPIDVYLAQGKLTSVRLEIQSHQHFPFSCVLFVPYQVQPSFNLFPVICQSTTLNHIDSALQDFYEGANELLIPSTTISFWQSYFSAQPQDIEPSLPLLHDIQIKKEILALPQHYRPYLQVHVPNWMYEDRLIEQIKQLPKLYMNGKVVWGALIHTTLQMFEPTGDNAVGEILIDPKGQTSAEELQEIAQKLEILQAGKIARSQDQQDYIQQHENEKVRLIDYPCPRSLTVKKLKIIHIWFWRTHLPNGMLSQSYFPILIHDNEKVEVATVLPAWFWPKKIREIWLAQSEKKFGHNYDLTASIFRSLRQTQSIVPGVPSYQLMPQLNQIFKDTSYESTDQVKVKVKKPCSPIVKTKLKRIKKRHTVNWSAWLTRFVVLILAAKVIFELVRY